jgi:hypothetical protein
MRRVRRLKNRSNSAQKVATVRYPTGRQIRTAPGRARASAPRPGSPLRRRGIADHDRPIDSSAAAPPINSA